MGRRHQRRFALVEGGEVLASTQYDLSAILNQRPVRACGIGGIVSRTNLYMSAPAKELVNRLLEQAARDGARMALLLSETGHQLLDGFDVIPLTDVEVGVGGVHGDLADAPVKRRCDGDTAAREGRAHSYRSS